MSARIDVSVTDGTDPKVVRIPCGHHVDIYRAGSCETIRVLAVHVDDFVVPEPLVLTPDLGTKFVTANADFRTRTVVNSPQEVKKRIDQFRESATGCDVLVVMDPDVPDALDPRDV